MGRKGNGDVGLGSASGPQAPSRVVIMDDGDVRKLAVVMCPVLASPRSIQLSPLSQDLAYLRENSR